MKWKRSGKTISILYLFQYSWPIKKKYENKITSVSQMYQNTGKLGKALMSFTPPTIISFSSKSSSCVHPMSIPKTHSCKCHTGLSYYATKTNSKHSKQAVCLMITSRQHRMNVELECFHLKTLKLNLKLLGKFVLFFLFYYFSLRE